MFTRPKCSLELWTYAQPSSWIVINEIVKQTQNLANYCLHLYHTLLLSHMEVASISDTQNYSMR
jgi:hypothetical protein